MAIEMYIEERRVERAPLTVKEEALLTVLTAFTEEKHYAPSIREIVEIMHYKSTCPVACHLNKLEEKGYISRNKGASRSITIIPEGQNAVEDSVMSLSQGVPVLDLDEDGNLIQTGEFAPYLSLHSPLPQSTLTALRMADDSMVKIKIFAGDFVVAARNVTIKTGDLVVVEIDSKLTVREYRKIRGGVQLKAYGQAGDSAWQSEPDMLGKVIAVIRSFL
ncbi:MAG: repressor LexA [Clostridia bacterium]|nr:repressor LexA [Clostridia bacterium]